jgi:hypothetical protein
MHVNLDRQQIKEIQTKPTKLKQEREVEVGLDLELLLHDWALSREVLLSLHRVGDVARVLNLIASSWCWK